MVTSEAGKSVSGVKRAGLSLVCVMMYGGVQKEGRRTRSDVDLHWSMRAYGTSV
jgi:hypothetical protein